MGFAVVKTVAMLAPLPPPAGPARGVSRKTTRSTCQRRAKRGDAGGGAHCPVKEMSESWTNPHGPALTPSHCPQPTSPRTASPSAAASAERSCDIEPWAQRNQPLRRVGSCCQGLPLPKAPPSPPRASLRRAAALTRGRPGRCPRTWCPAASIFQGPSTNGLVWLPPCCCLGGSQSGSPAAAARCLGTCCPCEFGGPTPVSLSQDLEAGSATR